MSDQLRNSFPRPVLTYHFLVPIGALVDFDTLTPWAVNQDMENRQRNCINQEDLDQETFETPVINQTHPPYLHLVDFTHLGQRFSNSDLPPSYENCILESQPPSYSIV